MRAPFTKIIFFIGICFFSFQTIKAQAFYDAASWVKTGDTSYTALGWTMSNVGDVNGDGYVDFVVGGPDYSDTYTEEGKISLYYGGPSGLSNTPAWSYQTGVEHGEVGFSSDGGDLNGDGYSDIVAGCLEWPGAFAQQGKVVLFYGSPTGPSATPDWEYTQPQFLCLMGSGVALSGDVNGDGYNDLFCSAKMWDNGQTDEGKVWLFYGSAAGPVGPVWSWEPNQAYAIAGFPINYAGDVNSDGYDDVIIGANQYDNVLVDDGLSVCFYGSSSGLAATPNWQMSGGQKKCNFGHWEDGAGDVNGDGYDDVIVSALLYTNPEYHEGRAWIFNGGPTGLSTTPAWTGESNVANVQFGYCVAGAGDINADGYDDVVIGAKYWHNPEVDEGACFVYFGSATGLEANYCWQDESNQAGAYYGREVGGDADFNNDGYSEFYTSAYRYTETYTQDGKAWVWNGAPRENAFHYQFTSYCTDGADPIAIIDGKSGGTFSSSPAGLSLNATTGAIDLSASTIGTYNVTYAIVSECTLTKTISISITAPKSATFSYTSATYSQAGADPSPTAAGGAMLGTFSSTPAGLSLNATTGVIDLSASAVGSYVITNTVNASGCGTVTATFNITITSSCPAPTGLVVSAVTASAATLVWNAMPGATSYKVYLKPTGGATLIYNTVANTYHFTGLSPSTHYKTWVYTKCGASQSAKSASKSFITPVMRKQNEVVGEMRIYPNPANEEMHIDLAGYEGKTQLQIFDYTGKELWLNILNVTHEANEYTLPLKNYAAGVYLIEVSGNNKTETQQFIICR